MLPENAFPGGPRGPSWPSGPDLETPSLPGRPFFPLYPLGPTRPRLPRFPRGPRSPRGPGAPTKTDACYWDFWSSCKIWPFDGCLHTSCQKKCKTISGSILVKNWLKGRTNLKFGYREFEGSNLLRVWIFDSHAHLGVVDMVMKMVGGRGKGGGLEGDCKKINSWSIQSKKVTCLA